MSAHNNHRETFNEFAEMRIENCLPKQRLDRAACVFALLHAELRWIDNC